MQTITTYISSLTRHCKAHSQYCAHCMTLPKVAMHEGLGADATKVDRMMFPIGLFKNKQGFDELVALPTRIVCVWYYGLYRPQKKKKDSGVHEVSLPLNDFISKLNRVLSQDEVVTLPLLPSAGVNHELITLTATKKKSNNVVSEKQYSLFMFDFEAAADDDDDDDYEEDEDGQDEEEDGEVRKIKRLSSKDKKALREKFRKLAEEAGQALVKQRLEERSLRTGCYERLQYPKTKTDFGDHLSFNELPDAFWESGMIFEGIYNLSTLNKDMGDFALVFPGKGIWTHDIPNLVTTGCLQIWARLLKKSTRNAKKYLLYVLEDDNCLSARVLVDILPGSETNQVVIDHLFVNSYRRLLIVMSALRYIYSCANHPVVFNYSKPNNAVLQNSPLQRLQYEIFKAAMFDEIEEDMTFTIDSNPMLDDVNNKCSLSDEAFHTLSTGNSRNVNEVPATLRDQNIVISEQDEDEDEAEDYSDTVRNEFHQALREYDAHENEEEYDSDEEEEEEEDQDEEEEEEDQEEEEGEEEDEEDEESKDDDDNDSSRESKGISLSNVCVSM
jgi:hypothetical protein